MRLRMTLGKKLRTRLREARLVARGLLSTRFVVLAQLVAIRRCNLACSYCNEYDRHSPPVPLDALLRRIDRLGELETAAITVSGGEPLLHPELTSVIEHIRRRGAIAGLITNGYLLTPELIRRFNDAGLEHLQISIDNLNPDDASKKSLRVLDRKLRYLAEHADFNVNINSVLGGGIRRPEDALVIARRAEALGFSSSVGIIHDGHGALAPLGEAEQEVYRAIRQIGRKSYTRLDRFQDNLVQGKANDWRCRAGGRFLYVCEDGLVHYCSQRRGYPGIPIERYGLADLRRGFHEQKACAPMCTIGCAQRPAMLDNWRSGQRLSLLEVLAAERGSAAAARHLEARLGLGSPVPGGEPVAARGGAAEQRRLAVLGGR